MKMSYEMRRNDILENGNILEKYPFLQTLEHMMDETKRILDKNAIAKAKTKQEYYVPQIIKQAKMEKGCTWKKIREFTLAEED